MNGKHVRSNPFMTSKRLIAALMNLGVLVKEISEGGRGQGRGRNEEGIGGRKGGRKEGIEEREGRE